MQADGRGVDVDARSVPSLDGSVSGDRQRLANRPVLVEQRPRLTSGNERATGCVGPVRERLRNGLQAGSPRALDQLRAREREHRQPIHGGDDRRRGLRVVCRAVVERAVRLHVRHAATGR